MLWNTMGKAFSSRWMVGETTSMVMPFSSVYLALSLFTNMEYKGNQPSKRQTDTKHTIHIVPMSAWIRSIAISDQLEHACEFVPADKSFRFQDDQSLWGGSILSWITDHIIANIAPIVYARMFSRFCLENSRFVGSSLCWWGLGS